MSGMESTRAKAAWKDGTEDAAAVIYRDQIMKDLECQVIIHSGCIWRSMGNHEGILSKGKPWSDIGSQELTQASRK